MIIQVEFDNLATTKPKDKELHKYVIDFQVHNVNAAFNVKSHLHPRDIALRGFNVTYKEENGWAKMEHRNRNCNINFGYPTSVKIFKSGKMTLTGARSTEEAYKEARRYARQLQQLGYSDIKSISNFRVTNIMGTTRMPFGIKLLALAQAYKDKGFEYEPELNPNINYKIKDPKANVWIGHTGHISVTAKSIESIEAAIKHVFPLVEEFRSKRRYYY